MCITFVYSNSIINIAATILSCISFDLLSPAEITLYNIVQTMFGKGGYVSASGFKYSLFVDLSV